MAFKFKYENLLKLRKDKEDDMKFLLAEKISILEEARNLLKTLKSKREDYIINADKIIQNGCDASFLNSYKNGKTWYKDEIKSAINSVIKAEEKVSEARLLLMEASMEKKKIEKLKEKDLEKYREKEEKELNEMIDGVISFNAVKNDN